MEFNNFRREVMGKGQNLVNAYEPGKDEYIDNIPANIEHRNSEVYAAAQATGYGKPKRQNVDTGLMSSFLKLEGSEYSCERVLIAHLIGKVLNEYDKRLSQEPMTWKELQKKMEIAFNYGPNDFQDVIRGAIELGYRCWYNNIKAGNLRTTVNTARKGVRRGPKRPNVILLPSKEEISQFAKEG